MKKAIIVIAVSCMLALGGVWGVSVAFEKTPCVAVWEDVYENGRDREATEIRVKHFASEEEAIKYLNENEVKKQPWESSGGFSIKWRDSSYIRILKKSIFMGVYPLTQKLSIKKSEEPMPLTKEVWKKEVGK